MGSSTSATRSANVYGAGLLTAVGLYPAAAAAAVRAGISRYSESHVHFNADGEPYVLALIPDEFFPASGRGIQTRGDRLMTLAAHALRAAVEVIPKNARRPLPCVFAAPEPVPGVTSPIAADFLSELARESGVRLDLALSTVEDSGAAGSIQVIGRAIELLASGRIEQVIVGAADCPLDQKYLAAIGTDGRLRTAHALDAYVPGEGSAFLLLARRPIGSTSPLAVLHPPGVARETAVLGKTDRIPGEPRVGDGLATALRAALAPAKIKARSVLAGLNGQSALAKEWGIARVRNEDHLDHDATVDHPADCYGDLGAATGLALVALAAIDVARGRREAPCVVWCASQGGLRAAITVDRDAD